MIAPHRRGRVSKPTQDGRALRRYARRWKVDRLFAWLHNFRRLVTRYENHAAVFCYVPSVQSCTTLPLRRACREKGGLKGDELFDLPGPIRSGFMQHALLRVEALIFARAA